MAIDFEEEEEPKVSLAICSQHNLKYDPEITWGCVLCRGNHKKKVSGYAIVGGIFAAAAGIYLLLPVIRPANEPELSAMVSVSTDDGENADYTAVPCLLKLSREIETCITEAQKNSGSSQMDREFCLNKIHKGHSCTEEELTQDFSNEPLYKVNSIPRWNRIREVLEENQTKIEKCIGSQTYDFTVRVSASGQTGEPGDITLSLDGLTTTQRFCLYQFFKSLTFPKSSSENYAFVSRVPSKVLALNRPKETDDREAEFRKFLEEQRSARLKEQKHAEIMKRREEYDKKFKSDMSDSK